MRSANRAGAFGCLLAAALAAGIGVAPEAAARGRGGLGERFVAMNGVDSPDCGGKSDPCRTLFRGIFNVDPGGTVVVGPGRYGDTNGLYWDFRGELGEATWLVCSAADAVRPNSPNGIEYCMWAIRKPVRIVSEQGAATTVLHMGNRADGRIPNALNGLMIFGNDVTLGEAGHGFTIKTGVRSIYIRHPDGHGTLSGITIEGNLIVGALEQPIDVEEGTSCSGCVIRGNVMIGNYQRMHDHALVDSYGGGSAYEDNIEVGRGFSYETFAFQGNFARNLALVSRSYGFGGILRGKVEGNSALASLGDGFLLHSQSDADVSGNASIGNLTGLRTDGSAARMQDNLLLGNAGCGADLNYYSTSGGAPPLSFDANGVYGNGVGRYGKNGSSGIAASSCGVEADRLDLQDNFWGSPSGPGGDPADAVYGIGNVSVPYATKEPKLKRKQRKPTL